MPELKLEKPNMSTFSGFSSSSWFLLHVSFVMMEEFFDSDIEPEQDEESDEA